MISSIEWVPKGVANPTPKKYELSTTEAELVKMMEEQGIVDHLEEEAAKEDSDKSDDDSEEEEAVKEKNGEIEGLPADLRMDEYSSDEDENDDAKHGAALGSMLVEESGDPDEVIEQDDGQQNMDNSKPNTSDDDVDDDDSDDDLADVPDTREYEPIDVEGLEAIGISQVGMNMPMNMNGEDGEDDDSDAEDVRINADDAMVVVAKTEEDFASLEVHVYEQNTGNLFVHHDVPLPAFPLCLAHGDIGPSGSAGNFCAVGMFTPGIEIWNLDVLNALEPSCILGGVDTSMADELMKNNLLGGGSGGGGSSNKKKKKKKKKAQQGPQLRKGSHTDAVMSLSWNKIHRQAIASGSADCTVKIWDVTHTTSDQCNDATFTHHRDKVQSVLWHPTEGSLLATGSYDRTVALVDARSSGEDVRSVKIPADCEALAWDPFNPQYLTSASEDGTIMCWDVRKFSTSSPVWSFVANEYGGVSDLSYNPTVPGMLATCAVDKTVTLWDTYNESGVFAEAPPRACGNKDMGVGKLYTVNFYPSAPWLLGCGGGGKELALWDMSSERAVQNRFAKRAGLTAVIPEESAEVTMNSEASTVPTNSEKSKSQSSSKKKKDRNKKKKKVHRAAR